MRLGQWAGSSEPLLPVDAISTKISSAGLYFVPFISLSEKKMTKNNYEYTIFAIISTHTHSKYHSYITIRIRGKLYSKFSFGKVYHRIYGRKFSFTCDF